MSTLGGCASVPIRLPCQRSSPRDGYASLRYTPGTTHPEPPRDTVYPSPVILEIDPGAIRDIAAALHAARKREPSIEILSALERKVMEAITKRSPALELGDQEAQALRNVLMQRAYDQRNTTEGIDYMELADRIGGALEAKEPPLQTTD